MSTRRPLHPLSRTAVTLLVAACTGDPVAPPEEPAPIPMVRFVGTCTHPAIWWLQVDGVNLPPTGIWLFAETDSESFPAMPGAGRLDWAELDGTGWAIGSGVAALDSVGAVRTVATCR